MYESLEGVKAGDVLVHQHGYGRDGFRTPITVERVTATQIVFPHQRFRICDGRLVGGASSYSISFVRRPRDGEIHELQLLGYAIAVARWFEKTSEKDIVAALGEEMLKALREKLGEERK